MTQQAQSAEEKARLKKQWTELAIQQALASQWEDAVVTNRNILSLFQQNQKPIIAWGRHIANWGIIQRRGRLIHKR
jgi:hypothetical protein